MSSATTAELLIASVSTIESAEMIATAAGTASPPSVRWCAARSRAAAPELFIAAPSAIAPPYMRRMPQLTYSSTSCQRTSAEHEEDDDGGRARRWRGRTPRRRRSSPTSVASMMTAAIAFSVSLMRPRASAFSSSRSSASRTLATSMGKKRVMTTQPTTSRTRDDRQVGERPLQEGEALPARLAHHAERERRARAAEQRRDAADRRAPRHGEEERAAVVALVRAEAEHAHDLEDDREVHRRHRVLGHEERHERVQEVDTLTSSVRGVWPKRRRMASASRVLRAATS